MGRGMNSYDDKKKRAVRRRNHIARDLADRKFRQRRIEVKKDKYPIPIKEWDEDDGVYYWNDNPIDEHGELIKESELD